MADKKTDTKTKSKEAKIEAPEKTEAAAPGDNTGSNNTPPNGLPVSILAQYVRDISFENANAPDSLRAGLGAPEMNINIGMDARKLEDEQLPNLYEVVLSARAEATRKGSVVFIAEILYGITVAINEKVPQENHHPLLLIEVPHQAFPHVRQILSDLTMQGGYPPLLLNPVDFHALYMQRFGKEIEAAREAFEKDLREDVMDGLEEDGKKPN